MDCLQEGRRVIRVYDLNMPEPACIGVQPMTLLASPVDRDDDKEWYVMADPMDFTATSTENAAPVRCRVGSDGRIEFLGER